MTNKYTLVRCLSVANLKGFCDRKSCFLLLDWDTLRDAKIPKKSFSHSDMKFCELLEQPPTNCVSKKNNDETSQI